MNKIKELVLKNRRNIAIALLGLIGMIVYQFSYSPIAQQTLKHSAVNIEVPAGYFAFQEEDVEIVYFVLPTDTTSEQDQRVMIKVINQIHADGKAAIIVVCPGALEQSNGLGLYECTGLAIFPK